jgi:hypothetical protein
VSIAIAYSAALAILSELPISSLTRGMTSSAMSCMERLVRSPST